MVVIVGGGLVGSAAALAVRQAEANVALVAAGALADAGADWDSRIYALSPGSVRTLEDCGAWERIDSGRVGQIDEMRIYGDDGDSQLTFSAYEAGVARLAVTVENRQLQKALDQELEHSGIEIHSPRQCQSLDWDADSVTLKLTDGTEFRAQLIVGADGAESWVREHAGIVSYARSYAQSGVVANFECEKPHRNIAYQWFRRDGVLAYLPLPGQLVSIVFSTWNERAAELLQMPQQEFCEAVEKAGSHVLGALKLVTPPRLFPLQKLQCEELIGPRVALIGDAAHVVHPLAGQGVNIGFRDVRELASVLRPRGAYSCGDRMPLRRFERARKEDLAAMGFTIGALQKLFNNDNIWLKSLRNFGLKLTDSAPPLKTALIRRAMA